MVGSCRRVQKRAPKELGENLVLERPQLANVENKFPVIQDCPAVVSLTENLLSSKAANGNCRG